MGGKYSYKDIYESLPDKEIVNAYNNTDYLRWQMHGTREEFLPQNARSITPDHETINKGYSAFNNIEEALDYHHFTPNDDDWVVLFNGKKIGSGVDGEPLVIPNMKSVAWFKWDDVVRSLSPRKWIESLFPHWGNINKSDVIRFFEADESKFSIEEWKKLFKEEFGDDADEIDKILSKLLPSPTRPPEVGGEQYQSTPAGQPRGATEWIDDMQAVIHAFEGSDISTPIHEVAHVMQRLMELYDPHGYGIASAFVGAKEGQAWTEEQHELFAKAFEQYCMDGKAPTVRLRDVFAKMKRWMVDLYRRLIHGDLGIKVSPEMRQVFDSWLTTEQERRPIVCMSLGPGQCFFATAELSQVDDTLQEYDDLKAKAHEMAIVKLAKDK